MTTSDKQGERILEVTEDFLTGDQIIRLSSGRCVRMGRRDYEDGALGQWCEAMDVIGKGDPVDVIQDGHKIGEMPSFWHPGLARSSSPFYDYRRGDLVMQDGKWIASRSLGGGDLDCLIGFVLKATRHD